jgi:ribosome-binding ATPase YchF (GTP1/OBG family)
MHNASREATVLERCREELDQGRSLRQVAFEADELKVISGFTFLSRQPLLVVLNTAEEAATEPLPEVLKTQAKTDGLGLISTSAVVESEIARLDPDDQGEFLASMGLGQPASARLIRAAHALLDTISFFTVGEDEVRAWTVRRGSPAPRAAGRVHSEIERGFIRAEVMSYDEFIEAGSEAKMKALGRLRIEGKEYVVNDGDIINFRFNV